MRPPVISCADCGFEKPNSGTACLKCGALSEQVTVQLVGNHANFSTGTIGTVSEEKDRIEVKTPDGARSNSRLNDQGIKLEICGPAKIGRSAEPRALSILMEKLRIEGCDPILESGRDEYGEDGILSLGNVRFNLQLVTCPRDPSIWNEVQRGSSRINISNSEAAKWVRDAVVAKATGIPVCERRKTLLVLDVGLTGLLARPSVCIEYLGLFIDPVHEFSFSDVWLVGPTIGTTIRLSLPTENM